MNEQKTVRKTLAPIEFHQRLTMGCDPEFFFTDKDGQVCGSEKVLPEKGIQSYGGKFVIDGVQAELNPNPSECRETLGSCIRYCFCDLIKKIDLEKVNISADPLVEVSQKEMDSLSDKSKVFGCAPSMNIHQKSESKINVDPTKYLRRSAGGHIHLGFYPPTTNTNNIRQLKTREALKNPVVTVPILDIVLGNTCVLMDRDPSNIERRQVYGKAGEFRLKDYGLEYRTLSNFWLQSYTLMSFVMGLARFAIFLVEQSTPENDYVKALHEAVSMDDIVKAIQENDFDLAYQNFKKIEPILLEASMFVPSGSLPFTTSNIKYFHYFLKKGIKHFFKTPMFEHWTKEFGITTIFGWERFLALTIPTEIKKENDEALKKAAEVAIDLNAKDTKSSQVPKVEITKSLEETSQMISSRRQPQEVLAE